jgi:hypothetical protein
VSQQNASDKKNLVMGLAKGYQWEVIRPFFASLRNSGYSGDICLFYSDLDERTVRSLREYDVELVPFTMGTVNLLLKRVSVFSLLNHIYRSPLNYIYPMHKLYYDLVNRVSSRQNGQRDLRKFRIAAKTFNVYCVRFPLYYLYLAQHQDKYARVMLSDVRDVVFQRDPFDFEFEDGLCFFMEDDRQPIKNCPYNSLWLRTGYGEEAVQEVGDQIASCSGTTIGSTNAIMRYLDLMVDHMLRLKFHPAGMDQGVHNYLLYKNEITNVKLFPNRLGPVFTMGKTVDLPTRFNEEGLVLNIDGTVAHVLHQYDRHVEVGKLEFDQESLKVRSVE